MGTHGGRNTESTEELGSIGTDYMIKAIIFDYGGVIANTGKLGDFFIKEAKRHKKKPEKIIQTLKETWEKARVNEISSIKFWEIMARSLKMNRHELRKKCLKSPKIRKTLLTVICKLKKQYLVGLLSNHIEDWLEERINKYGLNKLFDVIVTSYGSRKAKPDIKIYEEMLRKLKVKGKECVYIEDVERYLLPAKKLGMKTILFKNTTQTISALKALKIKF